jgi:hypothetical protein
MMTKLTLGEFREQTKDRGDDESIVVATGLENFGVLGAQFAEVYALAEDSSRVVLEL